MTRLILPIGARTEGAMNINFVERFPGSPPSLLIFIAQGLIGFAVFIFLSRIFLSAVQDSPRN